MNLFRAIALVFCSSAVFAVSNAAAQRRDPALDWSTGVRPASEQRTAEAMHEFTSCIARTMRRRSIALLSMPYPSAEASAETRAMALAGGNCMNMFRARFQEPLLRGGLFEAYYRRDFPGAVGPRRRTTFSPRVSDLASTDARRLTNCVVAREGARSDALIRTYPGTDAERLAVAPLMPAFRACAQETGVSIPNLRLFRAALAESLYLSRASETAQAPDDAE
jgi:hypothetical protein